jgi:phosphoribosylformylglycinamidine synthase subunit PurQ / glutaminase
MARGAQALLLKFPGTNCEVETARALGGVGFATEVLPIARCGRGSLEGIDLVVLSGGFSYGDYVMAGRLAQLEIQDRLGEGLREFVAGGGHVMGICNGFQILMRLGMLPEGSLVANRSGRFECRWVELERGDAGSSPYLRGLPERFELPVANAEGRFVARPGVARQLVAGGLAALRYVDNRNGSDEAIAGVQDETGRVFGLMPHPERFFHRGQHPDPDWAGMEGGGGWGQLIFSSLYGAIVSGED